MAQKPGGQIPNQGNPPQAKGVGKNSRRHDLERQATPGLSGSDLQQGDVSRFEQGQKVAPIKKQAPARGQQKSSGGPRRPRPAQGSGLPDALSFASERLGGSLTSANEAAPRATNSGRWMPLLQELARTPGAGGTLRNAYIAQLSNVMRRPSMPGLNVIDITSLDESLE